MKRNLIIWMLGLMLFLAGCAGSSGASEKAGPAAPEGSDAAAEESAGTSGLPDRDAPAAKQSLTLVTGSVSGTYYPLGNDLARLLEQHLDVTVHIQSTGASRDNLRLINAGEADLAIVQNDALDHAWQGGEYFSGERLRSASIISFLYPEVVQIGVAAQSDIYSVADLAGRRISVGDPGSGTEVNSRQLLEAHGMSFRDLRAEHLSFAETATAFREGRVEGFILTSGLPNTAVREIMGEHEIRFLDISEEGIEALVTAHPFYNRYILPGGTYPGQAPEDTRTVAVKATLVCSADLDSELVYRILQLISEHRDELAEHHIHQDEVTPRFATEGATVPFHPGAARFYRERGLDVEAEDFNNGHFEAFTPS